MWLLNDRTTNSNTLTLTTRKCLWLTIHKSIKTKLSSCIINTLIDSFLIYLFKLKTKFHVLTNVEVWIKSV